jgi:hypothetical protein
VVVVPTLWLRPTSRVNLKGPKKPKTAAELDQELDAFMRDAMALDASQRPSGRVKTPKKQRYRQQAATTTADGHDREGQGLETNTSQVLRGMFLLLLAIPMTIY